MLYFNTNVGATLFTSFSTASTSSIVPGSAKERILMLYFNTNVGATLCKGIAKARRIERGGIAKARGKLP